MCTYLAENLVSLVADETAHLIEMHCPQRAATKEFGAHLAPDLYDRPKHLIVAIPSEQDLAGVELIQRASNGPHIDGVVIRHAKNDLRRSIEPTDQVWRDFIVGRCGVRPINSRPQVTDLEDVALVIDLGYVSTAVRYKYQRTMLTSMLSGFKSA